MQVAHMCYIIGLHPELTKKSFVQGHDIIPPTPICSDGRITDCLIKEHLSTQSGELGPDTP